MPTSRDAKWPLSIVFTRDTEGGNLSYGLMFLLLWIHHPQPSAQLTCCTQSAGSCGASIPSPWNHSRRNCLAAPSGVLVHSTVTRSLLVASVDVSMASQEMAMLMPSFGSSNYDTTTAPHASTSIYSVNKSRQLHLTVQKQWETNLRTCQRQDLCLPRRETAVAAKAISAPAEVELATSSRNTNRERLHDRHAPRQQQQGGAAKSKLPPDAMPAPTVNRGPPNKEDGHLLLLRTSTNRTGRRSNHEENDTQLPISSNFPIKPLA